MVLLVFIKERIKGQGKKREKEGVGMVGGVELFHAGEKENTWKKYDIKSDVKKKVGSLKLKSPLLTTFIPVFKSVIM